MVPSQFHRPYIAAGHAADSPAVTGHYSVVPAPSMDVRPGGEPHVAEPESFTRGPIHAGHEADPPANDPGGNNPYPAGVSAEMVYEAASARYAANRSAEQATHLMPSQHITATPAPARAAMLPASIHASDVPHQIVVAASRPAPGESR
jgi:hypothetical protein